MRRRGFVLITILWVIVVTSAIAAVGAAVGMDAAAAHKNRINGARAGWHARACAERARFGVDRVLAEAAERDRDSVWRALDLLAVADVSADDPSCVVRFVAAGSRLNVNTASRDELERLFTAAALAEPPALAAALLDWIDEDDLVRESGAEAANYAMRGMRTPRNGPIADVAEVRYVLGFGALGVDSLLTADSARVSIANAPLPVLASLPGFGSEVIGTIAEWRATGRQVTNLLVLAASVSPPAEAAFIGAFPEIARRATLDPEAWFIRATGHAGYPRIEVTLELQLVRAQSRAALIRRREW